MIAREFRLKDFDGPLDLLLTLIGKAQIDIRDIFVSEITDQYLEIVRNAPDLDMDEASDFLLPVSYYANFSWLDGNINAFSCSTADGYPVSSD